MKQMDVSALDLSKTEAHFTPTRAWRSAQNLYVLLHELASSGTFSSPLRNAPTFASSLSNVPGASNLIFIT